MPASTPFETQDRTSLGDTDTAAGSKCPDVPVDGRVGSRQVCTGAAKALLKVLDKAPEAALAALH